MIVDTLMNSELYAGLHAGVGDALGYLAATDLSALTNGRHELDGDRLYAIVAAEQGRSRAEAPLESHRRYVDIQMPIEGEETIGWSPLALAGETSVAYDRVRDIAFHGGVAQTWVRLVPGTFAVFFPEDAHAPLVADGPIRKIVIKVRL